MRQSYTVVLEITPTSPLQHGAGTEGNEQILMTREYLVEAPDDIGGWERIEVPAVSGSALKATLREHAVRHYLHACGVEDGGVSKDALRLLLKGGRNDKGASSLSLDQTRELDRLFPLLAVFGHMDRGAPRRGSIQVSDVLPWCTDLVDAGLVPRTIRPMEVTVEGETITADMGVDVYEGVSPIPLHLTRTRTQHYRHDMRSGPMLAMLQGEDRRQLEDATEARATKAAPKKDERREANESMPYSAQCIAPGVPLVATVRLHQASDVEWACLAHAIASWVRSGGHLGGGAGRGAGACRVRVAGAIRYSPAPGEQAVDPGTAIALGDDPSAHLAGVYAQHIAEQAEDVRKYVAESTR